MDIEYHKKEFLNTLFRNDYPSQELIPNITPMMFARTDTKESYGLTFSTKNTYCIFSRKYNGYLTLSINGELQFSNKITDNSKFKIIEADPKKSCKTGYGIMTINETYLCADYCGNIIIGDRTHLLAWETFKFTQQENGTFTICCHAGNKENNGNCPTSRSIIIKPTKISHPLNSQININTVLLVKECNCGESCKCGDEFIIENI